MDQNKLEMLRKIGYAIRPCCGTCDASRLAHGWGTCVRHSYDHLKHTDSTRELSIHQLGFCASWSPDHGTIAALGLHAFEEFLDTKVQEGPMLVLEDDTRVPWSLVKERAKTEQVAFRVLGGPKAATFFLRPDRLYQDSYVMAWITVEENVKDLYLDRRRRSTNPDDFLSLLSEEG